MHRYKLNPKAFFAFANRSKKVRTSVRPLKDGPKKMAEILSAQYEGAFSKPKDDYSHLTFQQATCEHLDDLDFTEEDIIVDGIKGNSAPRPDGIPVYLLKTFKLALMRPLHYIWRVSLDSGIMPEGVSRSTITPIFKEGNRSAAKDYRPVELTNHTTKIFDRVLRKALVHHLEFDNLLNDPHGFRNGRS